MSIIFEERKSDSPYVETVTYGRTVGNGSSIRPAEVHWHMVFAKHRGRVQPIVVGPWTTAGVVAYGGGAEILWIKFKLGTFMPQLRTRKFIDTETVLPVAAGKSFWLHGATWQFPDFENADTFVDQLVRDGALDSDQVVRAVLRDPAQEIPSRTVRHRFAQATGLAQSHIRQVERAQLAAALLEQGTSILDTVYEVGYYDQPHLTRSLKRFIGKTPTEI